jgi:alkanesulfonate monooxygenase SsuD/methylene tetrahydromethanopterin reductase-like flavin-dependent oxidoreductase (luciferase family)
MNRGGVSSVEDIRMLSKSINSYGYYSILFVYHSKISDNLVKISRAMSKEEKLKYMIAIRTYAISPEYMAMICQSFDEMIPNKIMLNIVSGDIHGDETSLNDLIMIDDLVDTPEKRLEYTDQWIKKFISMKMMNKVPEIVMGGHSKKTREMSNKYDATHLGMVNSHIDYINEGQEIVNLKQMVSVSFVLRETQQEIDDFSNLFLDRGQKQWTFIGNKDFIINTIKNLENIGVTDLIISGHNNDEHQSLVHDIIRELVEV